jgi:choline dehydrogenase-like flavoprotein
VRLAGNLPRQQDRSFKGLGVLLWVDGLWVADASVMPTVVSCNTNAAAIMIGEKAVDLMFRRNLRDQTTG